MLKSSDEVFRMISAQLIAAVPISEHTRQLHVCGQEQSWNQRLFTMQRKPAFLSFRLVPMTPPPTGTKSNTHVTTDGGRVGVRHKKVGLLFFSTGRREMTASKQGWGLHVQRHKVTEREQRQRDLQKCRAWLRGQARCYKLLFIYGTSEARHLTGACRRVSMALGGG